MHDALIGSMSVWIYMTQLLLVVAVILVVPAIAATDPLHSDHLNAVSSLALEDDQWLGRDWSDRVQE